MEVEPFSGFEWIDTFGQNFIAVRNYVNELHDIVRVGNGESFTIKQVQPTMGVVSTSKNQGKKANEVRFVASGSMLTKVNDDDDVRRLIHNMMELKDGTTIDTIYLECMHEYQEKYFSMKPNEWRHLVRDYVREVTNRSDLKEDEVFTFKAAIA